MNPNSPDAYPEICENLVITPAEPKGIKNPLANVNKVIGKINNINEKL